MTDLTPTRKSDYVRRSFDTQVHCGETMDRTPEKYQANLEKYNVRIDELERIAEQRSLDKHELATLRRKKNRKSIMLKNLKKIEEQGVDDRPCMKRKGQGTDHPGVGSCRFHCVCKGRPDGHLLRHGRRLKDKKLQDLMDEMDASGRDILDLSPTVLLLEAKLELFVNEKTDFDPETVKSLTLISDQLRKTIETINDKKFKSSITMEMFNLLMAKMGEVVMKHINDPEILERILIDWGKVSIEANSKRNRAQIAGAIEAG